MPLQVEHVAVEFVVEPFRPFGPSLRTMKTSAQWCRVDTSYFPIAGRLVERGSVLFFPVQVQRTCPLLTVRLTATKRQQVQQERDNQKKKKKPINSDEGTIPKLITSRLDQKCGFGPAKMEQIVGIVGLWNYPPCNTFF